MTSLPPRASLLSALAAMAVSLGVYLPVIATGHITRDSGVFVYTGMVVSRGGMPYVDSWDHKGPLLAVIEAAAWNLGGSIRTPYVLEAILLFLSLAAAGFLWSKWVGSWACALVLVVGVTYASIFEGGNFTETWLFPFQLVAYSVVAHVYLRHGREASTVILGGVGLFVGVALSIGLFTRMNNVAGLIVVVVASAVVFRRRVAFMAATGLVIVLAGASLTLWLLSGDALRAGIDQYVRYNLAYSSGAAVGERLSAVATLTQLLLSSAVVAVALVLIGAWIGGWRTANAQVGRTAHAVIAFFVVGVVDTLSQVLSGRPYPHYLVVAISGFAVAAAVAAAQLSPSASKRWDRPRASRTRILAAGGLCALAAVLVSSSAATGASELRTTLSAGVFVSGSYQARIVDRVLAETTPNDRVLVHGAETWILASTGRLSPTPITYSLPVEQGYGGLPAQYLAEIQAVPPTLIVESPTSCGISIECGQDKAHFEGLAPWVAASYELEGDIEGFRFWRRMVP